MLKLEILSHSQFLLHPSKYNLIYKFVHTGSLRATLFIWHSLTKMHTISTSTRYFLVVWKIICCPWMLIKVLLIIFKNWKQTTWHLIDEWYILFYLNNTYYISPLLFSLHQYHHGLLNQYFPLNRVNKSLMSLFYAKLTVSVLYSLECYMMIDGSVIRSTWCFCKKPAFKVSNKLLWPPQELHACDVHTNGQTHKHSNEWMNKQIIDRSSAFWPSLDFCDGFHIMKKKNFFEMDWEKHFYLDCS